MKKLILVLALLSLTACAPSGNGEPNYCEATPTALVALQIGDRVDQTAELISLFTPDQVEKSEANVDFYVFSERSSYGPLCYNMRVLVDHSTKQVLLIDNL